MADLSPLRLLPALLLPLVAGCTTSADFEGRDSSGLHPTARVTFDLGGEAGDDPIHADEGSRWTAEVEGTATSGEFGRADYDVAEFTAGGRYAVHRRENSRIDLLIGGALTSAELDADGIAGFVEFDQTNAGPYLGFDARYFEADRYAIYGRLQNAWLFSDATSLRAEIGTEIHLGGPVNLLVGYRWWRYIFDEDNLYSSDADAELRLRGVVAGLQIGF